MRREAAPTEEFKAELLTRIMGAPAPRSVFRFAAVGVASFTLVFGMGTGVYAYESPDVVDGHPLYPIKQGMETVEGRFAETPDQRAEFHLKMMRRRVTEAERLDAQREKITEILESATEELELSANELDDPTRDPARREKILNGLSETSERYETMHRRVPVDAQRPLRSPEAMRERLRSLRAERLNP